MEWRSHTPQMNLGSSHYETHITSQSKAHVATFIIDKARHM